MVFQTKITIDGIDVTTYTIFYKVVDTVTDMTTVDLQLNNSILNIISLEKDQEVIITRGTISVSDNTIFKGNVSSIVKDGGDLVRIQAFDKLWLLQRKIITISYDKTIDDEGGVVSAIVSDLITRGGQTPDVEDSGSAIKIDKYIIRNDSILDHLKELANLIDYWVYYDPDDDKVKFKSKGFESFGTNLEVGSNLVEVPKWEYDYTKMANDVTLTGDRQELVTDEGFGSAVESVTLTNKPESVEVAIGTDILTGGVPDQDSTFDYSVDKENKKILFQSATSDSGTVSYSFKRPVKVRKKNLVSIDKYRTYALQKTIDTIQTTDDGEIKADEILNKFPSPIVSAKRLGVYNIFGGKAGQKVSVVDSINDENRILNIRRYTYNYPDIIDEIDVDDEPIYEDYVLMNAVRRRLERLERRNEAAGDLITQILSLYRDFKPRRRYSKLQKQSIAGDTLIWNHPNYGIWNSYKWGSTAQVSFILGHLSYGILGTSKLGIQTSSAITVKLVQGDMTYYEDFRDTEFNSGSTDAVINTSGVTPANAYIEFSSGSIYQTSEIDVGTSLNSVRLDVGTSSGSFLYEVSNNGQGNWTTVSNGQVVNITTSGNSTILRVTADVSGTIKNIMDDFGQVTAPAIKLIMNQG